MLRILDEAEQAAARIDWGGGGDGAGPDESAGDLPPLFRGISLPGPPLDHLVAPGQMPVGTTGSVFRVQDDDTPLRPEDGDLLHGREPRRPDEPPPAAIVVPPSPPWSQDHDAGGGWRGYGYVDRRYGDIIVGESRLRDWLLRHLGPYVGAGDALVDDPDWHAEEPELANALPLGVGALLLGIAQRLFRFGVMLPIPHAKAFILIAVAVVLVVEAYRWYAKKQDLQQYAEAVRRAGMNMNDKNCLSAFKEYFEDVKSSEGRYGTRGQGDYSKSEIERIAREFLSARPRCRAR